MTTRRWQGRQSTRLVALCLATYGTTCHLCGRPGATSADHLTPRSRGGDDSIANLRPCHLACNAARGAMPLDEWKRKHRIVYERTKPSRNWYGNRIVK